MQATGQLPNQAKFRLRDDQQEAEANVSLQSGDIGMVHGIVDKPGCEFDVVIQNMAGQEHARRHFKPGNERFGERMNLSLPDTYYKIKVENVKGTKSIDVFVE